MASREEPQVDDTRGLPDIPAPQETLFEEETTEEETTEEAAEQAAPAAERNGELPDAATRAADPVSPARPRGVASFPGGPPPVSTPPPTMPLFAQPETPAADAAPRFRVTTVENTGAFRPAGPPPPVRPRSQRPPAAAEAEAPGTSEAQVPVEPAAGGEAAEAATPEPATPEPATPKPRRARPSRSKARDRAEASTSGEPTGADAAKGATAAAEAPAAASESTTAAASPATGETPATTAEPTTTEPGTVEPGIVEPSPATSEAATGAAVVEAVDAATADQPTIGETGPREAETAEPVSRSSASRARRRRGRSGRTAAPESEPAEPATTVQDPLVAGTAEPPAPLDQVVAEPRATGDDAEVARAASRPSDLEAATQPTDGLPAGDAGDDEDEGGAAGSARTRARRRRRAAAKARLRGTPADQAGEAEETDQIDQIDQTDETDETDGQSAPVAAAAATTAPAETVAADAVTGTAAAGPAPTRTGRAAPGAGDRPQGRERGGRQRTAAGATPADVEADADQATPTRARGRGRRRGNGSRGQGEAAAVVEPAAARTSAPPERSTRLEANRTRGVRQGVDRGRRRRRGGLTEDQKRVLREGPDRRMLVTEGAERTQIGVIEGRALVEHYVTRKSGRSLVGNIYLGRVQNVLPGMEAAFVDIGKGRNAVLYAGEVNYNEEDLDGEAPRIEKALKPGQAILVQVTKDPIGAKGARLTTQVSLAGRYLVLQPEDSTFGISRRLPEAERIRLREILKEVRPKGLGLIVRTAAEGATADDLRADLARLQARWETIERKGKKASPPAAIYQEPELVVRVIRDIFSPDFVELVVDAPGLYERVRSYLEEVAPDLLPKVRAHDGKLPLFEQYRVTEQIHKALERKVWLPSGGSLVIDQTEAMTVVDVNTGKYVGKSNLEETVVATNLEAAEEIVRQLRLRDIGGIIIIDFIDMLFEKNQQAVVDRLRSALARDKTKSQVMEVSSLGLVQMTRKRVSGGLLDSFSETCPTCEGRGVVITHEV